MNRVLLVFDLDGTLVDSVPDLRAALNEVLRERGHPPLSLSEVKHMVGDGAPALVARAFAASGGDPADAIGALARSEDATVEDFGIVRDRLDDTIAAVRHARDSGADILVTSGGASVGDYDLVQKAFTSEGMALAFWRLALRPGRPLMNGRLGGMHVLGVPGNPVSAFVCSFLFLVPLIRRLAGRSDLNRETESAKLGVELSENDERADYLRATLARGPDVLVATPFPVQDSSMMLPLAKADCLIIREPYDPAAKIGDICRIVKFER